MALVKQAKFATMKGVSRKTVTQWKRDGKLVFSGDLVDVEASQLKLLREASHAAVKQRAAPGKTVTPPQEPPGGNSTSKVTGNKPCATDPLVTPPADPDPDAITASADAFATEVLAGRFRPKGEAETIKENALALKQVLEARRLSGVLISREAVVDAHFRAARAERDTMLAWPGRVAPMMAADLGADSSKILALLTEHMHALLTDLGDSEVDLDAAS